MKYQPFPALKEQSYVGDGLWGPEVQPPLATSIRSSRGIPWVAAHALSYSAGRMSHGHALAQVEWIIPSGASRLEGECQNDACQHPH